MLGKRIKAYRLFAGLSLRDLSELTQVSAQALSQYETGRVQPRSEVVKTLASALGTSVEQLQGRSDYSLLRSVRFQHLSNQRPRIRDETNTSMISLLDRYLAIEQKLGGVFPSPSLPSIRRIVSKLDQDEADSLAFEVRRAWSLGRGPLPTLVSLFETRGVKIFDWKRANDDYEFRSCSAFVSYARGTSPEIPVVLLNGHLSGEQKRFALCKELANLLLPSMSRQIFEESVRDRFSDLFSRSLLLPAPALHEQLGWKRRSISWYELTEIKKQFGVPYLDIACRCWEIAIISRKTFDELIRNFKRQGWIVPPYNEPYGLPSCSESSTRLTRLALRAITEGVMSESQAAVLLDENNDNIGIWLFPPKPR